MCFSFTHFERNLCYNSLKNKDFIFNLNDNTYENQPSKCCGKVPVWINYEYTHKFDTHLNRHGYSIPKDQLTEKQLEKHRFPA